MNMPRLWSGLDYLPAFWVRLLPGPISLLPGFLPMGLAPTLLTGLSMVWNPNTIIPVVSVILGAVLLP